MYTVSDSYLNLTYDIVNKYTRYGDVNVYLEITDNKRPDLEATFYFTFENKNGKNSTITEQISNAHDLNESFQHILRTADILNLNSIKPKKLKKLIKETDKSLLELAYNSLGNPRSPLLNILSKHDIKEYKKIKFAQYPSTFEIVLNALSDISCKMHTHTPWMKINPSKDKPA